MLFLFCYFWFVSLVFVFVSLIFCYLLNFGYLSKIFLKNGNSENPQNEKCRKTF